MTPILLIGGPWHGTRASIYPELISQETINLALKGKISKAIKIEKDYHPHLKYKLQEIKAQDKSYYIAVYKGEFNLKG